MFERESLGRDAQVRLSSRNTTGFSEPYFYPSRGAQASPAVVRLADWFSIRITAIARFLVSFASLGISGNMRPKAVLNSQRRTCRGAELRASLRLCSSAYQIVRSALDRRISRSAVSRDSPSTSAVAPIMRSAGSLG